jgi:hypothetical protein
MAGKTYHGKTITLWMLVYIVPCIPIFHVLHHNEGLVIKHIGAKKLCWDKKR